MPPLTPSAGYTLTLRVNLKNVPGTLGRLTTAIGRAGGDLGAVDLVEHRGKIVVRDLTVKCRDEAHSQQIVKAASRVEGVEVRSVRFPSAVASPDPQNNTVHCEYFRPKAPGRQMSARLASARDGGVSPRRNCVPWYAAGRKPELQLLVPPTGSLSSVITTNEGRFLFAEPSP